MIYRHLQITYRKGAALAAYLYLPQRVGEKSARTEVVGETMVIDFARDGRPLGVEIVAPSLVSLAGVNRVLRRLGVELMTRGEFGPLSKAG